MTASSNVISFIEALKIPTGPFAGKPLKLAAYQKRFIVGALAHDVNIAVLSIGRGNGKSALVAAIALAELFGVIKQQPRREIIIAARTRDQAEVVWAYAQTLCQYLPLEQQELLQFKRSPKLQIEFHGDGGGHVLRCIAADAKTALGQSPTLVICDERGHWAEPKGSDLEQALLTALPKRRGRMLICSTSAPNDQHPFSQWLDHDLDGVYRQEHKANEDAVADDLDALKAANPGHAAGLIDLATLQRDARRAIQRGGTALQAFKLYNLNQRVSDENRSMLLMPADWQKVETLDLPARKGAVVIGLDAGGSASMSAAAYFWPETQRLEVHGWFPSQPTLLDRGQNDAVGDGYLQMAERGELSTIGGATVPLAEWIGEVMARVQGQRVAAIVCDRFKQAEMTEGFTKAGVHAPIVWRGFGYYHGSEDVERFRRAVYDGEVKIAPSLLMRTAMSESVVMTDPAGNVKLVKGRSLGRIDPVAASIIAIGEGARQSARPKTAPRMAWA